MKSNRNRDHPKFQTHASVERKVNNHEISEFQRLHLPSARSCFNKVENFMTHHHQLPA